uniref:Acid phosphatase 5, tartrate resistant n=1 Tax=Junco hyemalis TaxID=40217 RepID=A0A8C5JQX9_JUNHY
MPWPPCLSVSLSLLSLSLVSPALGAPGGALSFLALGDWGGLPEPPFVTPRQVATAAAMGRAAAELGGDFVLALGDNFYYEGVKDEWDPRFQDTFERVFVSPGLRGVPWFVMAGNHDHAGNVTAQLRYSRHSPRWYGRDTGSPRVPKCPRGSPRVRCGHGQVRYGQVRQGQTGVTGTGEHRVSAYLCGRDHNLQYLEEGGVAYVLSGAGNFMEESRPHERSVPPGALRFFYGSPESPGGFAHVRLEPRGATVTFLESTGRVLHRVTLPPRL